MNLNQIKRGERSNFVKPCITMDPKMLYDLKIAGLKLKEVGVKDTDISSMIRYATENYIKSLEGYIKTVKEELE
jgi:hypothetical protein